MSHLLYTVKNVIQDTGSKLAKPTLQANDHIPCTVSLVILSGITIRTWNKYSSGKLVFVDKGISVARFKDCALCLIYNR